MKKTRSPKRTKSEGIARFAATYGNGEKNKRESRAAFMARSAQAAVQDLKAVGKFRRTSGGQLFYTLDKPIKVIPLIAGDIRLQVLMSEKFGINSASTDIYRHLVTAFQTECYQNGEIIEVYQFSHADKETKTFYMSLFDGQNMIKVDGDEEYWDLPKTVPNGTDGVFFLDDPSWEPWRLAIYTDIDEETGEEHRYHKEGVAKKLLVDTINFAATERLTPEEQRWIFEQWLRCLLLDLEEKPLLLLSGPPGSGKTVAMGLVKKALLGRNGSVDMITKQDAFTAAVTNTPFLVMDNLDGFYAEWLISGLATASTGVQVNLRVLYTTNDKIAVTPRAWIALTSTDSRFADNQPAIADRTIVLAMNRIEGGFGEKGQAEARILKHRDEILTDLLFQLHHYVRAWRASAEERTSIRIAAFGLAVERFAAINGEKDKAKKIFEKLQRSQGDLLTEHDSLFTALDEWFALHPDNDVYVATAGMVAEIVWSMAHVPRVSAITMGRRLSALKPFLEDRYQMTSDEGKRGSTLYTFHRPRVDGEKRKDQATASTADVTPTKEVA